MTPLLILLATACKPEYSEFEDVLYNGPYDQPGDHHSNMNPCQSLNLVFDVDENISPAEEGRQEITNVLDEMATSIQDTFSLADWADLLDCNIEATTASVLKHNVHQNFESEGGFTFPMSTILESLDCTEYYGDKSTILIMSGDQRNEVDVAFDELEVNGPNDCSLNSCLFYYDSAIFPNADVALEISSTQFTYCKQGDGTIYEFLKDELPVYQSTKLHTDSDYFWTNFNSPTSDIIELDVDRYFDQVYSSAEVDVWQNTEIVDQISIDWATDELRELNDDTFMHAIQLTDAKNITDTYGPEFGIKTFWNMVYDEG